MYFNEYFVQEAERGQSMTETLPVSLPGRGRTGHRALSGAAHYPEVRRTK
jgi:hypothetical protein